MALGVHRSLTMSSMSTPVAHFVEKHVPSGPARVSSDEVVELSLFEQIAEGAIAGLVATAAMSGAMVLAQRVGLMGKLPPKKLTQRMLGAFGVNLDRTSTDVLATVAHFAFGATAGAMFSLGWRPRHAHRFAAPLVGSTFGTLIWLGSYAGWIPALGLMPAPHHDRPGRPTSMVLAHIVFGGVLGTLVDRWRTRE